MSGFELNKIAAAVLLAGIIAILVSFVADALYQPELEPKKRGYEIAGADAFVAGSGSSTTKQKADKPVDILQFMANADAQAGAKLTKKCMACHSFDQGGGHKVGPNLYGVLGRDIASASGYAYSDALKAIGGKWDYQKLSEFLHKPKKFAKGTKMVFAGIKKPQQRADLIMYLRSLGSGSIPIPAYVPPAENAGDGADDNTSNDADNTATATP